MRREGKPSVSWDIIVLPWREEEGGVGGVDDDVIIRSYLFQLPPLQDNGPFVDRSCQGGHGGAPRDTDGVIMLCHN